MEDKNPSLPVFGGGEAEEPSAAAHLEISLEPIKVAVAGVPVGEAHPAAAASPEQPVPTGRGHSDEPTASAILKIRSWPITVEVGGAVPASETPLFISTMGMSATGIAGIIGAVVTVYVAASHLPPHILGWFLGVAAAELALAGAVVFRIGRPGRSPHLRQDHAVIRPQPVSPSPSPLGSPQRRRG